MRMNSMKWARYFSIFIVICFTLFAALYAALEFLPEIIFLGMMANFGESTVTETVPSPEGTYEAYVISHDEGALGGSTSVRVKEAKKWGLFQKNKEEMLQRGKWGEEYDLVWIDDDTLEVNGETTYEMGDIW